MDDLSNNFGAGIEDGFAYAAEAPIRIYNTRHSGGFLLARASFF
jgi:hypothetical protein